MQVLFVTIDVLPQHLDAFLAATADNHRGSVAEPGCLRFDVVRDQAEPGRVYLYEVYRDAEAIAAHKQTAHYQRWNAAVAPWLARPRSAVRGALVHPQPYR
jgi:autoinducer 2-degrading protein